MYDLNPLPVISANVLFDYLSTRRSSSEFFSFQYLRRRAPCRLVVYFRVLPSERLHWADPGQLPATTSLSAQLPPLAPPGFSIHARTAHSASRRSPDAGTRHTVQTVWGAHGPHRAVSASWPHQTRHVSA